LISLYYNDITIYREPLSRPIDPDNPAMARLLSNPHLSRAKRFHWNADGPFFVMGGSDFEDFEAYLQALVSGMPGVEIFEWASSFDWAQAWLPHTVLERLAKGCPSLSQLSIRYPSTVDAFCEMARRESSDRRLDFEVFQLGDITAFVGLTSLALHNMFLDLLAWRQQLVVILKQSPSLKNLELSVAPGTAHRLIDEDEMLVYLLFFHRLCRDYHEHTGGEHQLRLKSLRMGGGVHLVLPEHLELWSRTENEMALQNSNLEWLTDPACLEDVHMDNDDIRYGAFDPIQLYEDGPMGDLSFLDFGFFTAERFPNLRRFSTHRWAFDVKAWWRGLDEPFRDRLVMDFEDGIGPTNDDTDSDGSDDSDDSDHESQDDDDGEEDLGEPDSEEEDEVEDDSEEEEGENEEA
jgi:hypothetical protein